MPDSITILTIKATASRNVSDALGVPTLVIGGCLSKLAEFGDELCL